MNKAIATFVILSALGCSTEKRTNSSGTSSQSSALKAGLPFGSVINLGQLFATKSTNLSLASKITPDSSQCRGTVGGAIGSVIRNSCILNQLAVGLTYGKSLSDTNHDGIVACDEIDKEKQTDLISATCHGDVMNKQDVIEALVTGADSKPRKISFSNAGSFDAVGAWNKSNQQYFPFLVRLWSDLGATSNPDLAAYSKDSSSFEFWSKVTISAADEPEPTGRYANRAFRGALRSGDDLSNCKSAPSVQTCLSQDLSIWFGAPDVTADYQPAPDDIRVRVLADDATNPEFMAVEGMYVISDNNARWASINPKNESNSSQTFFENARTVYFQAIRSEGEVWGRMVMRDAQGNIASGYGLFAGAGPVLSADAGHCIDLTTLIASSSSLQTRLGFTGSCQKINASLPKFTSIWEDESKFTKPSADWVGIPEFL